MTDSILEMSDEEFLKLPDDYGEEVDTLEEESSDTEEEEDVTEDVSETTDTDVEEDSTNESDDDVEDEEEASDDDSGDSIDDETEDMEESDKEEDKPSKEEASDEEVNYEDEYKNALAPLVADGEELPIASVKELRDLASMGVNYYGKMQALKPHRKTIKTLADNKVDVETLNYLLELKEGKPEAIKKLLQDHKIDPTEFDLEEVNKKYSPESYEPSDVAVNLDTVLDEVRLTPSFDKTMDILGNQWDSDSKQILQENPQIIKDINSHVASGVYDKIAIVIKKERLMGKLDGVSDIDAYKKIGDALAAQGAFNESTPEKIKKVIKPETKKASNVNNVNKKKRAVSPSSKSKTSKITPSSILELSDEDFEKQFSGSALYE